MFYRQKKFLENLRDCLVRVFENCFLFSKTRKIEKTHLVHSFFFVLKNIDNIKKKTLNLDNKNSFHITLKWCFPCVFKNRNQTSPNVLNISLIFPNIS